MPYFFTEESLTANISSFWSTYLQEISRQGDLLRQAEIEPLCRKHGFGFRSYLDEFYFFDSDGMRGDKEDVAEIERCMALLNIPVPGTSYKLGAFVGDVNIED